MPLGEYRMIDDVQDDHPVKSSRSSCEQDDKSPDGRGRLGDVRGNVFEGLYIRKPNQNLPKIDLSSVGTVMSGYERFRSSVVTS